MPWLGGFSSLYGPVFALGTLGLLMLLLRWAFSRGASVVEKPAKAGAAHEYGLLVPVASPGTYVEGEILRRTLEAAGVRATLASTLDGPRVLVFPDDAGRAREILAQR